MIYDGCTFCKVDKQFVCSGSPLVCDRLCGNGIYEPDQSQECDDGDFDNKNGCSTGCKKIKGWTCTNQIGAKTTCTQICGDGILVGRQKNFFTGCDDGNTQQGDGCSDLCVVQPLYTCNPVRTPHCVLTCVNGKYEPKYKEQCDDGNYNNRDGCGTDCLIQPGWTCTKIQNMPSKCQKQCIKDYYVPPQNFDIVSQVKKIDTCINLINGTKFCYKDCSRLYFQPGLTSTQQYRSYIDNLYCNDHNFNQGDGCTNCSVDPGFVGSRAYWQIQDQKGDTRQTVRMSYCHQCTNNKIDGNQLFDFTFFGQSCDGRCILTKGTCGNLIYQPGEVCDSVVGCKPDCTGFISTNMSCFLSPAYSYTQKYGVTIQRTICKDTRINVQAQDIYFFYLDCSLRQNLDFSNFTMNQIRQFFIWNQIPFYMFENNAEHYTSIRLFYYLFSFGLNQTSKEVRIKYNSNNTKIKGMDDFVTNVIARAINRYTWKHGYVAVPVGIPGAPQICGDGMIVGNQGLPSRCDDGNKISGDGCSATCIIQPFYYCVNLNDDTGPSKCQLPCGDGLLQLSRGQVCDDGDRIDSNGCNNFCKVNSGWNCISQNGQKSNCSQICGDGILVGKQKLRRGCDDGNNRGGDGCSNCLIDTVWVCSGAPSVCAPSCGNGKYEPQAGQECDDFDQIDLNGCSKTCKILKGWYCIQNKGVPSACYTICGDGILTGFYDSSNRYFGQQCDDGDIIGFNGCSNYCQINLGWNCTRQMGNKSICYVTYCKNTFTYPAQNLNKAKTLRKPDTCITLISGTKYCYKDCTRIYYNAQLLAQTIGDTKYSAYMDKLYCNDHNYKGGDGCTNCSFDLGFHGSKNSSAYTNDFGKLIQTSRYTHSHKCGNQKFDEQQFAQFSVFPTSCQGICIFQTKQSICGNLILEWGEGCDSILNCKPDCSVKLSTNFSCSFGFTFGYDEKYQSSILTYTCQDRISQLPAEFLLEGYLAYSTYYKIDFSDFKVAYIKQLFAWNKAYFDIFQTNPEYYHPIRLIYYLFQAKADYVRRRIKIVYNKDIPKMASFVIDVLGSAINTIQSQHGLVCSTEGWPGTTQICGDGILVGSQKNIGRCDDGNTISDDGCDVSCKTELYFKCLASNNGEGPTICTQVCGDGLIVGKQRVQGRCDDGNKNDGDGCNSTCYQQKLYKCVKDSIPYCSYTCGNGKYEPNHGELCDDGDFADQNGCNSICEVTTSFECVNKILQASNCTTRCRQFIIPYVSNQLYYTPKDLSDVAKPDTCITIENGQQKCFKYCAGIYYKKTIESALYALIWSAGLTCDDHNLIDGDGCTQCQVDPGYTSTKVSYGDRYDGSFTQQCPYANCYLQNFVVTYSHRFGNGMIDQNQVAQFPQRVSSIQSCIFSSDQIKQSTCGNNIIEIGQQCDGIFGCKSDCSAYLPGFDCNSKILQSLFYDAIINLNVLHCRARRQIPIEAQYLKYLKNQQQLKIGFYNFTTPQIRQLFDINSFVYPDVGLNYEYYTTLRLFASVTSGVYRQKTYVIKYNQNIPLMSVFVSQVLRQSLYQYQYLGYVVTPLDLPTP